MEDRLYRQLYEMEERHWWFRGRRAVLGALLAHAPMHGTPRILDAGCGTGFNLQEFGALGSAQGVDPSAQAVAFCHERGLDGVSQSGLEALPFERDSFDLLMALDVIEHIDADAVALAELGRVAAPGASLLITVPAYGWLWSGHDDTHHHFRRYTLRGLRERVVASGWRPTFATYFNSLLLPPIAAVRLLGRLRDVPARGSDYDRTPPALSPILEAPMRAEARLIARGVRLPAGVSVGMVSVRP